MSITRGDGEPSNGFKIVWQELKRRTAEPRGQFVYWTYFLGAVCAIGGIGVTIELWRYFYTGSSNSPSAIYFAMITFFPALVGSSAMQIMFENAFDKRMVAVSVVFLISTLGIALFLMSANGIITSSNWIIATVCCVLSLWIWWISNADNVGLYDEAPPSIDAPIGGEDPNAELRGSTKGYKL